MILLSYSLTGGFSRYAPQIRSAAAAVIAAHLEDLHAAILQSYEEDKSGNLATRDNGTVYQASAPGEAPAIKEGDLFASIDHGMLSDLIGAVWSTDPKAPWLEYGTDMIAPRPAFGPALESIRAGFVADMNNLEARLRR